MKRTYTLLILLLALVMTTGCAKEYDLEKISSEMDAYIGNYIENNLRDQSAITVAHLDGDFEEVIAYVGEESSGLVIFKYDKKKDDISSINVVSETKTLDAAFYSSLSGEEASYIGVFINDKAIWADTTNVEVTLSETSNEDALVLNEKTYGNKALIFNYSNADGERTVENFKLLDMDGQVLFTGN
jgi:hypothetical protein